MKLSLAAIIAFSTLACATGQTPLIREIPKPKTSVPYGLLALDTQIGDLKDARLVVSRAVSIPRNIPIPSDGLIVIKLPEGMWKVHISGRPYKSQVVRFGVKAKPDKTKERTILKKQWPRKSLLVKVAKNSLTWASRICAHPGCDTHWISIEDPALRTWEDQDRLVVFTPPENKEKGAKDKSEQ